MFAYLFINCHLLFFSFGLAILMAFIPNEISLGGVPLDLDTGMGNIHLLKGVEGVFESMPAATYQYSILLRTPVEEKSTNKF